ncbi:MAG: hydroxymethylbilane synthase [Thermoplasmata archaeon]
MTGAPLRVGSRRSPLARVQTEEVVRRLTAHFAGSRPIETVYRTPSGDRDRRPQRSPDFADALEAALREHRIDLAVHSAKDLPAPLDRGFVLLAGPRRADPREALVVGRARRDDPLPIGARVGTSSVRRRAQLLRWRPDLRIVELRGNVEHRVAPVLDGRLDAVVLAAAGLLRLGRREWIGRLLPLDGFLPAPGQGILGLEIRRRDRALGRLLSRLAHPATARALVAERAVLEAFGGDCEQPLGALATERAGRLTVRAELLDPDGRRTVRSRRVGDPRTAGRIGAAVARDLLRIAGRVR